LNLLAANYTSFHICSKWRAAIRVARRFFVLESQIELAQLTELAI